ncbi:MAG: protein-glutamate O-methyltransferase CheR [Firmicutes bacterium]|nr:protein-glutamate O-methyltransferase CheR [Bacillota bacterium]
MTYEDFKKEILSITGINLSFYKEKQMKRRIDSLIRKNKFNGYYDYFSALKANKELYNEFINYLTINVSEFYRNPEQWEVLENDILPQLISKKVNLKIWSAACSTGDEPYTLAMILNKFIPLNSIKIIATDIDKEAIDKAKAGIYVYKSMEKLPKEYLDKYFIKTGELYKIKDDLKKCVEFSRLNLLSDLYPQNCDMIVCRNVLIYFTEEAKNIVYIKASQALNSGGILFVGSTEQIIMPGKYNFTPVRTFFYMKT